MKHVTYMNVYKGSEWNARKTFEFGVRHKCRLHFTSEIHVQPSILHCPFKLRKVSILIQQYITCGNSSCWCLCIYFFYVNFPVSQPFGILYLQAFFISPKTVLSLQHPASAEMISTHQIHNMA